MEDAGEIFIMRSDERMVQYVDIPIAKDLEDAKAFIRKIDKGIDDNEWINWGLYQKGSVKLMGTVCIWNIYADGSQGEAGYMLLPEFQGKGYMQEALEAVIPYGFNTMKLLRIEAYTHAKNEASLKLLEKFRFVKCMPAEGNAQGMEVYVIENNGVR